MRDLFEIRGDTTAIFLYRRDGTRLETLIDTDELPKVMKVSAQWHLTTNPGATHPYAMSSDVSEFGGEASAVLLHRCIMEPPDGAMVDHINHETLDNRRRNLRLATAVENGQNRVALAKNNKSGVRGVSWCKAAGKWRAQATVNGKIHYLGVYEDINEAALVVQEWRREHMPFSQENESAFNSVGD